MRAILQDRQNGHDLNYWRLLLGLLAAPAAGILLVAGPMALLADFKIFSVVAIVFYVPSLVWSLLTGVAYMLFVVRRRREISWHESLLIGAIVALTLPSAVSVALGFYGGLTGGILRDVPGVLWAGLLLIPSGAFGGWVFWWITSLKNKKSAMPEKEALSQSSNSAK